jgi:hypothetical protein
VLAYRSDARRTDHLCAIHQLKNIGDFMNINLGLTPLISLVAGILILVMPKLLNFIVAIYLIMIGLIGLFGTGAMHIR